jgi:hypothetical protein
MGTLMNNNRSLLAYTLALSGLWLLGVVLGDFIGNKNNRASWRGESSAQKLVRQSRKLTPVSYCEPNLLMLPFQDVAEADKYLNSHPDYTSYHTLLAFKKCYNAVYYRLPPSIRARILCSALHNTRVMNDWGLLSPEGAYDDLSALALLESGPEAIPLLVPILDDTTKVGVNGSKETTTCSLYRYRRCDYAYRYLCLLLGCEPTFRALPLERDKDIDLLKKNIHRRERAKQQ